MAKYDSNLHKEIVSLPTMVRYICSDIQKKCETVFTADELKNFDNIVLSGCGDSLCAAYAVKECYEQLLGLHIDTPVCLDLSRHYDVRRFGEKGKTLVILISFSGKVSRVVEAAQRARANGAITMAVTHDIESPVAAACDKVLHVVPEEFDLHRTPGCRTYVASMTALYQFGIAMGQIIGNYDMAAADGYRQDILDYVTEFEAAMDQMDDELFNVAVSWKPVPYFEFLSSGPEYASAWFGQAKMYEATGDFSRYENFEDWAHVDYILRKMDSGMFLFIDKKNPAFSRAQEVASVLTRQSYRYLVFTDANKSEFADPLKVFTVPTAKHLWLTPLMQAALPCMFAGALAHVKGTTEFCADMIDSLFPFGGAILRNSKIELH
ncbi:SIS domain-containing protein [Neobittarella massiliensis]|uniref:Glutamine--fructose-6-phosphate aminotransferase [isomerizing] n=1 Tax=Neobittarella massiliensis (ex Bilen et al. 2018) TaxID=2041842 RepID=A0A8J6IQ62_9FIRM|nr:SIS domain-containing protein [Neobittarella massiliensis]MBC3516553.1 SIS domain-containing protein [Neobittarella massiliensis]